MERVIDLAFAGESDYGYNFKFDCKCGTELTISEYYPGDDRCYTCGRYWQLYFHVECEGKNDKT